MQRPLQCILRVRLSRTRVQRRTAVVPVVRETTPDVRLRQKRAKMSRVETRKIDKGDSIYYLNF